MPATVNNSMNTAKIYRNTAILTALRLLEPAISLVVVMAISRHMGPAIFGAYSVLVVTINIAVVMGGQLGLTTLLVREVAKKPERAAAYLHAGLKIALASSVLLFFGFGWFRDLLNLPPEVHGLAVLASLGIFPAIAVSCYEAVFTGFEKMELVLFRSLIAGVIRATLMVGTVFFGGQLLHLILVDLVTGVISMAMCFGVFHKLGAPDQQRLARSEIMDLFKATLPFYGMSLVTVVAGRLDVLMLTRYRTVVEVGFYTAAYRFFEIALVLPISYIRASFPQLSNMAHRAPADLEKFVNKLLTDTWFYATGLAAVLIGFGGIAILMIFGHRFDESWKVLEILALALFPSCIGRIFSMALIAKDFQRYELIIGSITTLTNFALLWWLTPHHGIVGAAIATAITMTLGGALFFWAARFKLGNTACNRQVIGFLLSAGVCVGVVLCTSQYGPIRLLVCLGLLAPLTLRLFQKLRATPLLSGWCAGITATFKNR